MNYLYSRLKELTYYRRTVLKCKIMYARALLRRGFKSKGTILFYPTMPIAYHILYPICHKLGYRMTTDPNVTFDLAIAFEDATVRKNDEQLSDLSNRYPVLNARCGDISKEYVDKVFLESFGYGLTIDPGTYRGTYIKKTNQNAMHFGEIHAAPSTPEKGFVYQKLIDNKTDEHSVTDIRTFIFGNDIPFTLYRKRSIDDRFNDDTVIARHVATDAAFTTEEKASIIRFCRVFGLDYGELDVLRDNIDGKIYIVDVNNTPSGPHSGIHMGEKDYDRFLSNMANAFDVMAMKKSAHAVETVTPRGLSA